MTNAPSVMNVSDLASTLSLGVTVLAGERGLTREVLWAHSCEMTNPEEWLGPHELLMTVGLCVPRKAKDQAQFIGRLAEAGLAGVMIGDHESAPPITEAMLNEANERDFPVLFVTAETPFAVVARHVAAASSASQLLQVLKLSKLYQIAATAEDNSSSLMTELATLLRVNLQVQEKETGLVILEADVALGKPEDQTERRYPLRGRYPAELVVFEYPGETIDSFILVHLLKVLEVTLDRVLSTATVRGDESSRALARLLAGVLTPQAEDLLGGASVADGYQIAAFPHQDGPRIARQAALRALPVLIGPGRTSYLALIPQSVAGRIRSLAEQSGSRFGVSSVFTDYRDVRTAAEEAARVLSATQFSDQAWVEFEGSTIAVLTRSRREAQEIMSGVLGSLADHTPSAAKLRETLFAFLRNDRHWQETADELGIHRQTLWYRLNKIEEETGYSVTRTADLAALWIAYQAWETTQTESQAP